MITFKDVWFTYDGTTNALDGISLHIPQGSFVCVLGGNGSGKSTFAKHINALLVPDKGEVHVAGYNTAEPEHLYFIRSKAGMVFQSPDDQIVASLVENDVAFGPENLGVEASEIRARVTEALQQVGLQGFEKHETSSLSGGQKQRVAIAGVLAMNPEILVLDEASAMLDPRGRAGLMRVCRELNHAGMTIVMITHFMEEATDADIVYILDDGRIGAEGSPEAVLADVSSLEARSLDVPFAAKMSRLLQQRELDIPTCVHEDMLYEHIVSRMKQRPATEHNTHAADMHAADTQVADTQVGAAQAADAQVGAAQTATAMQQSESANAAQDARTRTAADSRTEGKAFIVFEQVGFAYDTAPGNKTRHRGEAAAWGNDPAQSFALEGVDFTLYEGEFFGIAGHTGSGKSTLLQHMNGLLHPTSGRVLVKGIDIAGKAEAAKARTDVGLVFQYPEHQLFAATVFDDVAFGPRNMGLDEDTVHERVEQSLEIVGLDPQTIQSVSPFELSGGQQRRVAFAGVLAMGPKTLILDEPAAGLDPKARSEFLQLIQSFHDTQGMTIVMASHSMDDLARLCDRILVLNQGHQLMLDTPARVFDNAEAMRTIGLDVPSAQRVANRLYDAGVIATRLAGANLYHAETLADAIADALR